MPIDFACYPTKISPLPGKDYEMLHKQVKRIFAQLKAKTKRQIYVRAPYFDRQKIFFLYFWEHLYQKPKGQRLERLKLFPCALELLKQTHFHPKQKNRPNESAIYYRFYGMTTQNQRFVVQVKEHGKSGTKQFMSVFPWK